VNGSLEHLSDTRRGSRRAFLAALSALALAGCTADSIGGGILRDFPPPTAERAKATFYIEPFEGIPGNQADSLAEQILLLGPGQKIRFIQSPETPEVTYRVVGRLAAASHTFAGTIFYTFEVVDQSNQVVFRVRDQESVLVGTTSALDPWASVKEADRKAIAQKLVTRLGSWLSRAS
jgi:hypothetical protein